MSLEINQELFAQTSHSPSLIDLVGYEAAQSIIDFCFVTNPYYPTPGMIQQLVDRLPELIRTYPSSNPARNARHLAAVLHVDPDNLIIGNGATELISAICDVLIAGRLAIPIPTFSEYLDKLAAERLSLFPLRRGADYQLDLAEYGAWLRQHGAPAALIINPANPTGQTFSLATMEAFLHRAADLELVLVDESFIDFAGDPIPSLLASADQFHNLIIVRSMSKHCGVPGLRLGYCYTANQAWLGRLRRALPTWNINTLAEFYLSLLPPTDADYHAARRRVIADARWLEARLRELPGVFVYPSGANFVLLRLENGRRAAGIQLCLLREHRLYVRDCANKKGMDAYHLRVASQGRNRDSQLVAALAEILTGTEPET